MPRQIVRLVLAVLILASLFGGRSLVANVTAALATQPDAIRAQLVEQVTGRVRWTESVQFLSRQGVTQTVEIGSGRVLTGLTGRIVKEGGAVSLQTPQDIEEFLKGV